MTRNGSGTHNATEMPADEFNIAQKNKGARELIRAIDRCLAIGSTGSVSVRVNIVRRGRDIRLGDIRVITEEDC